MYSKLGDFPVIFHLHCGYFCEKNWRNWWILKKSSWQHCQPVAFHSWLANKKLRGRSLRGKLLSWLSSLHGHLWKSRNFFARLIYGVTWNLLTYWRRPKDAFGVFCQFYDLSLFFNICPIRTLILISFIFSKKFQNMCQAASTDGTFSKQSLATYLFLILNFFCISVLRSLSYFLNIW